jgi:sugar lactone lactonase YvrE
MKNYTFLFFALSISILSYAQCVTVSNLAGSPPFEEGTGTAARFKYPSGVAVDASGNIYVADTYNHRIRKITPTGVVTTLAGSGIPGSADGSGTSANFFYPQGVAVDGSGNVYVADTNSHLIRKITPTGVVTTLAGTEGTNGGFVDGLGTSAQFTNPHSLAVDASGNIYVADTGNNCIRKITPTGVVTTLAGSGIAGFADGIGTSAQFKTPCGVAVDGSGNVYVADTNNHRIRKITPIGVVTTLAGTGAPNGGYVDGPGTSAQFYSPHGLAVDATGNIYVADTYNNRIRKITTAGVVTTFAGSSGGYVEGTGTTAKFQYPYSIAIDALGNKYVADYDNDRIRKITTTGVVTTFAGYGTDGYVDGSGIYAQFYGPQGIAVDASGNVFVADTSSSRIRKITPAGVVTTLAGGTSVQFNGPSGVAVDVSGNVYVADTNNHRIRKISTSGVVTTFAGSGAYGFADGIGTLAQFANPHGLAVDASGNIYVADTGNNCIRKITPSGVVTTFAGSGAYGFANGIGILAQFAYPQGVAIDGSGNVYVADTDNDWVRKITPTGVVTTFPGGTLFSEFYQPKGVAVDASGNVYVSSGSYCIKKISPTGVVTTLAGVWLGYLNGDGTTAQFSIPVGVALDDTGNVYVADQGNNLIRKIITNSNSTISADGVVATSTTITNGSSVQLQLNGNLNAQPNIQWTPATGISSATIANPVVYPSATTTYTASFVNNNGCTQTTSFTVNVTPQPNIGNLSISSSTATVGLFDTITVDVQLTNATNLYSLYMKLKGNAAVSQYLDYSGYTAGTLLGTNVISTAPTVTNGVPDFGMTKVGAVPGYSGSGLFYSFRFVPKNNVIIPSGTTFCFYLDDVSSYNASGIPCGLTNQGQYCYTFTNQVAVWPGDLNKSNTVTTADILPIGYFYNSTGAARANATIQWNAQPATLWGYNRTSTNSDAYKVFADSNGDGVINNADQAAIGFNMNQVHNRMAWQAPDHFSAQAQQTLAVGNLTVTPNSTIINGAALPQIITFTVNLNNTGGLNALYGMSVNLGFDNTVFDLSTATVDYTGSIFGNAGSDCLALNYNSDNTVSVGLTRFGNAPINGQGLLFKVTLQTKTTLPNLTLTPVTAYVDAANNQAGDTLVIQDAPATNFTIINNLGLDTIKQDEFVLYPNPASEVVFLQLGANTLLAGMKVKVVNLLGQVIEEQPILNNTTELSTKNWGAAGVYFVQIITSSKNVMNVKKIIKQ